MAERRAMNAAGSEPGPRARRNVPTGNGFVVRCRPATRGEVVRSRPTVPRLCRPRKLRISAVGEEVGVAVILLAVG